MLTVHHLGVSQSERIVWLCEELGIPYELVRYDRDPTTRLAPEAYRALHPMKTAPVITDGDLVLGESGAIVDYIIHRHGGGRLAVAPAAVNYADYLFWFHYANGSFMPAVMASMVAGALPADSPYRASLAERRERPWQLIDQRLGETEFLAGPELTAADIMTVFGLSTMRLFAPRDLAPYPNIRRYLATIAQRPGYRRAMAKGDPGLDVPMS